MAGALGKLGKPLQSISSGQLAALVEALNNGSLDKQECKRILYEAIDNGTDLALPETKPHSPASANFAAEIQQLLDEFPQKVHFYQQNRQSPSALDFFMGILMKRYRGQVTAQSIRERLLGVLELR